MSTEGSGVRVGEAALPREFLFPDFGSAQGCVPTHFAGDVFDFSELQEFKGDVCRILWLQKSL